LTRSISDVDFSQIRLRLRPDLNS